jgi:3-hydroxybutyryl-CoA dehydrogenase
LKKITKKNTKTIKQSKKQSRPKVVKPEQIVEPIKSEQAIPLDNKAHLKVSTKQKVAIIYIAGESPMVEQYAEICAAHGYEVYISWNEKPAVIPEFKYSSIKTSNAIPANTSAAIELTNTDLNLKRKNLEKIEKALPETAPILSSSIIVTATEQCSWISGKHRLIGISALPTLIEKPLVEAAPTIYSPKETIDTVNKFFLSIGKEIEIVQDRIGMVLPRIICQIINEAAFALTEDIALPQDIDRVLKFGVNFPLGPIEWAEKIGLKQVFAVLNSLHTDLQEERYRVAPLLKQMAITGEWWK